MNFTNTQNSFAGKTIRMLEIDDNDLRTIDGEAFAGLDLDAFAGRVDGSAIPILNGKVS